MVSGPCTFTDSQPLGHGLPAPSSQAPSSSTTTSSSTSTLSRAAIASAPPSRGGTSGRSPGPPLTHRQEPGGAVRDQAVRFFGQRVCKQLPRVLPPPHLPRAGDRPRDGRQDQQRHHHSPPCRRGGGGGAHRRADHAKVRVAI